MNCVENASALELNTLSLGWAVQKSLSFGVKSRGEAILCGHGRKRLSCNGWAEPVSMSIQPCLSLKVVRVDGLVLEFRLQGFGRRDSTGRVYLFKTSRVICIL